MNQIEQLAFADTYGSTDAGDHGTAVAGGRYQFVDVEEVVVQVVEFVAVGLLSVGSE